METIKRNKLLYMPRGKALETQSFISESEKGNYCLNHCRGCSHGCRFPCYAMLFVNGIFNAEKWYATPQKEKIRIYDDWRKPKLVSNAYQIVSKEIKKYKDINNVYMCFSTDPFMYNNKDVRTLSLQLIKLLKDNNIPVIILTKGIIPTNIPELYGHGIKWGISLVSFGKEYHRIFEPYTAPPEDRLRALQTLHEMGEFTWISKEPYPPIDIVEQTLEDMMEKISFVDKVILGRWNYSIIHESGFYRELAKEFKILCKTYNIVGKVKSEIR